MPFATLVRNLLETGLGTIVEFTDKVLHNPREYRARLCMGSA